MVCGCQFVPAEVLERLSRDKKLTDAERANMARTAEVSLQVRRVRVEAVKLTLLANSIASTRGLASLVAEPTVAVYDCNHSQSLPGAKIDNAGQSADPTAKAACVETTEVARFYRELFGRNSVDDAGLALLSSIHYGENFNNAFWNGQQMTYGDGDGNIFVDFTRGNDVIAHELTHGVTQYTLGLNYKGDAGGLNESISDVFGSMFRQWRGGQTADEADWLIGKDIIGPGAQARGFTCLRDMADPAAKHALAAQPTKYSDLTPGMDPHFTSGPPNLAFQKVATAIGGHSWEKAGKIWYGAITGLGSKPSLKMPAFAKKTRKLAAQLFPGDSGVRDAVDAGWKAVGL